MKTASSPRSAFAEAARRATEQPIAAAPAAAREWAAAPDERVGLAEPIWGAGGEESDPSAAHSKATADTQHNSAASSLVFQYFALLANFHGAVHVSRYWADIICPLSLITPSAEASEAYEPSDADGGDLAEELAAMVVSPTTDIDLGACYVGPATLLALADMLRVHCVTVPRGRSSRGRPSSKKGADALTTVLAPLWGAGARRGNADDELMCSLMPHLTCLRLARLSIDFTSPHDITKLQGGSAVLRHLLEALQGHPSLQVLDVSGNPIAAALVPAISRLVHTTPSLTTLVLDDTMLTDDEKKMLHAQCLLNQLRLQRAAAAAPAAPASEGAGSTSEAAGTFTAATRVLWEDQMREKVFTAVERGVSAVPWLMGQASALVLRYDASRAQRSVSFLGDRSTGGLRTSFRTRELSDFGTSSMSSYPAFDIAVPSSEMAYVGYDVASSASHSAKSVATASPSTPPPAGTTWSAECAEVVRCAFVPRLQAQRTVLGGRPVWSNVPAPLEGPGRRGWTPPAAATVAASDLLQSLREQVLPALEAPPGLHRGTVPDATFLTTIEENYWAVTRLQETQWGYVVQKVADNLVPLTVRNGATLYEDGGECEFMYFLPPTLRETHTHVEVLAGAAGALRMNKVLPGQWVGDAELLDGVSVYLRSQNAARGGAAGSPGLPVPVATSFKRCSTARVVSEAAGDVEMWALPFAVAFFFLYAPYQLLHKQFIRRTPMSAFANINPVHLTALPIHLHVHHGTVPLVSVRNRDEQEAPTLCRHSFLSRHVLLLEEGEFVLRLPSVITSSRGRHSVGAAPSAVRASAAMAVVMEDHHLLAGVTVLAQAVLDMDAAVRAAAAAVHTGGGAAADGAAGLDAQARGPQGSQVLGKEAALRRFRATKTAVAASDGTVTAKSSTAGGSYGVLSSTGALDEDETGGAELRPHVGGSSMTRWRYSAIANNEFAALCPELRLVLTRHCSVVRSH